MPHSLDDYNFLFRSERVAILFESPDLVEVIDHIRGLGYRTGNFKQIPISGFSNEGFMSVLSTKPIEDKRNLGVISVTDKDQINYQLLEGIGFKKY
jgi:hypothetical protein